MFWLEKYHYAGKNVASRFTPRRRLESSAMTSDPRPSNFQRTIGPIAKSHAKMRFESNEIKSLRKGALLGATNEGKKRFFLRVFFICMLSPRVLRDIDGVVRIVDLRVSS